MPGQRTERKYLRFRGVRPPHRLETAPGAGTRWTPAWTGGSPLRCAAAGLQGQRTVGERDNITVSTGIEKAYIVLDNHNYVV